VKQSSASTVGTFTIKNAKKTLFWLPPNKIEQQKIAAQAEKIEILKLQKKGLMQQLFLTLNEE